MLLTFAIVSLANHAVEADTIVGVNIAGWMILEPWVTPSLFYRFLDKTSKTGAAYDTYTFCDVLGG